MGSWIESECCRDSSLKSFGIEGKKGVRDNRSRELEAQGKSPQTPRLKRHLKAKGRGAVTTNWKVGWGGE